ncbi:MAG: hypothetical protein ACE5E7_06365 [Anaerolineae bacterium]
MKRHKLLLYELISRRMRGKLLWLGLILVALAGYDLYHPIFGDLWYVMWAVIGIVFILWVYYGVLMRRASVQIRPQYLVLKGPVYGMKISYGRVNSVISTHISRHYPLEELNGREQALVSQLYDRTCALVELRSYPKAFARRHLWFPRLLFGKSRPGLLLAVDNWMALSRDIEAARAAWRERADRRSRGDRRSLAARILDYDY